MSIHEKYLFDNPKESISHKIEFGEALRSLRKSQRITIKQLCENTGYSKSYIMDLETGRSKPSLENIQRLCTALNSQHMEIELLTLSLRKKVTLTLNNASPQRINTAAAFQRCWEKLTPKQLDALNALLYGA